MNSVGMSLFCAVCCVVHCSALTADADHNLSRANVQQHNKFTSNHQKQQSNEDNLSNNLIEQLLNNLNGRFESMNRCRNAPLPNCQCLWNLEHLRHQLWLTLVLDDNKTQQDIELERNSRLASIMLSNIVRVIDMQELGSNLKTDICVRSPTLKHTNSNKLQLQKQILSRLMPNVVANGGKWSNNRNLKNLDIIPLTTKTSNQTTNSETTGEEEGEDEEKEKKMIIESNEMFYDIEQLLRKLERQLSSSSSSLSSSSQRNQKCFGPDDLLAELKQHQRLDYLLSSTVNKHHNNGYNHQHQHNDNQHLATSNQHMDDNEQMEDIALVYIEQLSWIIVNRLAAGDCIELFETVFLNDLIKRYGSPMLTADGSINDENNNNNNTDSGLQEQQQQQIDQDGLAKMLNDLHIGGLIENAVEDEERQNASLMSKIVKHDDVDHHHDHEHEHEHEHDNHHHDHDHHHHEHEEEDNHEDGPNHDVHSHNHTSTVLPKSRSLRRRSLSATTTLSEQQHNHIHHHHIHPHTDQVSSTPLIDKCLDYQFYLSRMSQSSTTTTPHNGQYISANDLRQMAPIFVQQILSGACEQLEAQSSFVTYDNDNSLRTSANLVDKPSSSLSHNHHHDHHHHLPSESSQKLSLDKPKPTQTWEVVIYSSIAVFVISVSSICGVLIIPFLKSNLYAHLIDLLVGVAFGTMAGDALFHLLPTVLGLHSHEGEDQDLHGHQHHEHGPSDKNYIWYMFVVSISIYFLFLFELISNAFMSKNKGHHHHHPHEHHHHNSTPSLNNETPYSSSSTLDTTLAVPSNNNNNNNNCDRSHFDLEQSASNDDIRNNSDKMISSISLNGGQSMPSIISNTTKSDEANGNSNLKTQQQNKSQGIICGLGSLALIITLGDSIHNLIDGIAIGIAFSSSLSSGISTSIAVFCHELPHEFGDFAVLLSTGLSIRRAVWTNFLSALTAFIGLYIGIALGNNEAAERWALAVCTGLFFYVALVGMMPELKECDKNSKISNRIIMILVKNFGILFGYCFMLLLALYEDVLFNNGNNNNAKTNDIII